MVARTAKIIGSAYSTGAPVTIDVEYNGNIVYSGVVPTIIQNPVPKQQPNPADNWSQELATFMTDTDITGLLPCRIIVTSGTLFFGHFWMNYVQNFIYVNNPNPPPNLIKEPVSPEILYGNPNINTVESDGVTNTMKNGVIWDCRTDVGSLLGDWAYPVYDAEIFTFDFDVDPACVVLEPYVPPAVGP
jgi:hypothetical protein